MPVVQIDVSTANASKQSHLRPDGAIVPVVQDESLEQHQSVSSKRTEPGNVVESHDSCYSSCSEESHSSSSREPLDSIAKGIAQLSTSSTESNSADSGFEQQHPSKHRFLQNVDFVTRLGYSVQQLETVLGKLGMNVRKDQILDELIKFGPGMVDQGSKVVESKSPNTLTTELRSIVIDGSNIAMTYGRKEVFSCRGIRECVQFFRNRGHTDVIVFVPQFRREIARSDCPITDQYILFELEKENVLIWTPSRRINGRRIVCHDDRYILKTAEEKDAVIVSNDEYRDLIKENPQYRKLVDERLLMYSFVDGRFMPPDDPLGRHGPKLTKFLTKGNRQSQSQICPYARRCTYGNKCKYYHPERPNGIRVSVTDRLMKEKRRQFHPIYLSQPKTILCQCMDHSTQNLNIPISEKMIVCENDKKLMQNSPNHHEKDATQSLSPIPSSQLSVFSVQQTAIPFLPLSVDRIHQIREQHCFTPSNDPRKVTNSKRSLPLTPLIRCNHSATNVTHYYTTVLPSPYPCINSLNSYHNDLSPDLCGLSLPQHFVRNPDTLSDACETRTITPPHFLTPCINLRDESKFSLIRSSEPTCPEVINERHRLQNILCQLFPKQIVLTVMKAFPYENNPRELCSLIIAELQKDDGDRLPDNLLAIP
uniref:Bm2487 n=1 Tax=Brugia malayi TaxID=6279 RepID=A0A0K0J676_BRUMA|nr:Bm2487 [Brugia malayi]